MYCYIYTIVCAQQPAWIKTIVNNTGYRMTEEID